MNRIGKGFTLIELLISICLLAVMVLGFSSINLFTNFQVISSDRRAKLQNEASLALEHMAKQMSQAIGDKNNLPYQFYVDNLGIRVRQDTYPSGGGNGKVDLGASGDTWVGYRHEGNSVLYYENDPDGSHSGTVWTVSNRIVTASDGLTIEIPKDAGSNDMINEFAITVKARWDPVTAISVDNPEVILKTTVLAPSVSVK